jgi:hypothetical protein
MRQFLNRKCLDRLILRRDAFHDRVTTFCTQDLEDFNTLKRFNNDEIFDSISAEFNDPATGTGRIWIEELLNRHPRLDPNAASTVTVTRDSTGITVTYNGITTSFSTQDDLDDYCKSARIINCRRSSDCGVCRPQSSKRAIVQLAVTYSSGIVIQISSLLTTFVLFANAIWFL